MFALYHGLTGIYIQTCYSTDDYLTSRIIYQVMHAPYSFFFKIYTLNVSFSHFQIRGVPLIHAWYIKNWIVV